jgi:sugar phosphate isomerase/epimerase
LIRILISLNGSFAAHYTSRMKRLENKRLKLGLKLKSTDLTFLPEAEALYQRELFHYIELYVVPASYGETSSAWEALSIPTIIHAPHTSNGINIADYRLRSLNLKAYQEVKLFANRLSSPIIIAHAGCDGSIEEAINQLRLINEARIYIENKPLKGLNGEICRGCSPEEFKKIFAEGVVCGSVLDFGHASCAARSFGMGPMELIKEFIKFNPMVYHVSDGDKSSEKDVHLNLGKGDLNVEEFFSVIPRDGMVTLETPRRSESGLQDFVEDVIYLKEKIQLDLQIKERP